jgi:hypothetical protein
MKTLFKITSILSFGFITAMAAGASAENSKGGLFVEPAVTYELGETTVNYPSPLSDSTGKLDGLGLGVRFGFHFNEALFAAIEGRYSMPKYTDSSVNYEASAVSTSVAPVIGVQMPNIGLRIWGAYILDGYLDPQKSGSLDVKFQKASGYRVGAGFRVAMLSLNLEYQQLKYGQTTLEEVGPFSPGSTFDNVTLSNKSWIASVSFPLEF